MKTNRWGWFSLMPLAAGSQVGEKSQTIWLGAGRNIISKAVNVGTVVFTYSVAGGTPTVQIEITLNPGFTVNQYHAYIGDNPSYKAAAPGSYTDVQYPPQWVG